MLVGVWECWWWWRILGCTGWKGLLQLLGLVGVLEGESVEISLASDLELGLVGGLVLLYPGSCITTCQNAISSLCAIVRGV